LGVSKGSAYTPILKTSLINGFGFFFVPTAINVSEVSDLLRFPINNCSIGAFELPNEMGNANILIATS
jgi:hypothetical protein